MWVKKCVKICIMLFKNWKILLKMSFHGPSYKIYVFFWKSRHVATFVIPQFSFHVYVASVLTRLLDSRKVGYGFTFFTCTVSAKFYFIFIFLKGRKKKREIKIKIMFEIQPDNWVVWTTLLLFLVYFIWRKNCKFFWWGKNLFGERRELEKLVPFH